jgi:DNA-binding response OmpR family regulator
VLVIGPDLGFVFWLGRALDQAGYDAYPARSIEAAAETMTEFHLSPGLAILSGSLPGAPEFIEDLRRSHGELRVLKLARAGNSNNHNLLVDHVCPLPADMTEESKIALINLIGGMVEGNHVRGRA